MKNKLFFNVITLVLFFLTSNVILGQKVGEKVLIQYESPHPYHTVDQPSEIVWTQEITYTERATTYLSLHFSEFELHEGDRLIVRSPEDTQRWEYTHEDNKWDGFWSIPIYGNIAIVEIKSESSNNAFGYIIDEIVRGYTQEEMGEVSLQGGCLNPNDTENIACYRENEVDVYNKSKVVARLLLDGNIGCTGWLIGDEGHLITNAHCSSENFPFELAETPNVVVEMMAEGTSCGTNCNFPFACGGIIIASQVIPVKSSIANDYFLFQLQEDDRVKAEPYGYLTLRESGAIIGEQIFIPQHPHKFGKKIAFKSSHPEDIDGVCHVNEYYTSSSLHPDQIATYGDTFSGSSGSPVISKNDLCVVGLHHLSSDCKHLAIHSPSIVEDLGDDIPHNAICTPCETGDDIHINSPDALYDVDGVVGNIIVHSGAQLTVTAELQFGKGKSITIEGGGKLVLNGGTLTTCPVVYSWQGVEVQTGGEMVAINSSIRAANTAINARIGSTLSLNNTEVIGRDGAYAGIYLEGDTHIPIFRNMKIRNYHFGIFSNDNSEILNLDQGNISNTTYGIYLTNSTGIVYIHGYNVEASFIGIYLDGCPGSVLRGNDIEFGINAMKIKNSKILYVLENSTTHDQHFGRTAINLLNCEYARIYNNDNIDAAIFGIKAFQSNVMIDNNILNIQGHSSMAGGAIQLTNNTNSIVENNVISANQSSFGIESVTGLGNEISHNQISVLSSISTRTAAIRTMGGISEIIDNNIVDGLANVTGIIAQNSLDNTYDCNVIDGTVEGLGIYYNSEGQDIRGNQFLDSEVDLSIRSVIGNQYHTGNEFVNGHVRAVGLSDQDLNNSLFFVNSSYQYHMPSDPEPPSGWFISQNFVLHDYECSEAPGPIIKFHEDQDKLFDYFEGVKLLQATHPMVFNTQLYHLLKYERSKTDYNLPTTIKQDAVFTEVCGLEEMAGISHQIKGFAQSSGEFSDSYQTIQLLQNQLVLAAEGVNQEGVLNDLNESAALVISNIEDELPALAETKNELEGINCSDDYLQKWKAISSFYLEYLQTGKVAEKHHAALVEYSRECSDKYGDIIHLARALTNTFDLTYFDVYDNCMVESEKVKPLNSDEHQSVFIQPNPSRGTIFLHTEEKVTGTIKVFDVTGKMVHKDVIQDNNRRVLNLHLNNGMYFVQLTTNNGAVFIEKVIINK